ncbi:hypothetical protein SAMN06296020_101207 [Anoxynatronum buryatiense]|uniref:Uncharacterized protein n=2 Tax=Anoxynatronum buryatiense TaxID=489973 RepID=A0AA45WSV6_9CLOT|nr:hypothetical protein SAMN06296020_101207 [Anoxynatronum buryatiense]
MKLCGTNGNQTVIIFKTGYVRKVLKQTIINAGVRHLKINQKSRIHMIISACLLLAVLILWVVNMTRINMTGEIEQQLQWVVAHWETYQMTFIAAMAIAPVFLYFIYILQRVVLISGGIRKAAGVTLALFYVIFVTFSYISQLTLLPLYLSRNMSAMASTWFFYESHSIAYFTNQTGYALWGGAMLFLFGHLVKYPGLRRWLGVLITIAALLSLAAFAGLLLDLDGLNMLTLVSGALVIPIAVLSIVLAVKAEPLHREEESFEEKPTPQTIGEETKQ